MNTFNGQCAFRTCECGAKVFGQHCETCEPVCDHEGMVHRGRCESCGERGLESDAEIYAMENAL